MKKRQVIYGKGGPPNGGAHFLPRLNPWVFMRKFLYDTYLDPYNLVLTNQERKAAHRIAKEDQEMLEQVFMAFGKYSAWELREKTRSELPWREATQNGQCINGEINQQTMQKYFSENYLEE